MFLVKSKILAWKKTSKCKKSKRTTSHDKPKVVPDPQDHQVYGDIGPHSGGIRHFTFLLLGQCVKQLSSTVAMVDITNMKYEIMLIKLADTL